MAPQTSFVVLPLAVLVAVVIDVSSAEGVVKQQKTYFSPEATQMAVRLNAYLEKMGNSFDEFTNNLAGNNDLLTSVNKYRSSYEGSKGTECAGEEPPTVNDEDLMMGYINDCKKTLNSDPLVDFSNKLKAAKDKLEKVDDALKQNADTCAISPTGCEAIKQKKLITLNSILSDKEATKFQTKADKALDDCKHQLETCFQSSTKELHDTLEEGIKKIDECMSKHK